MKNLMTFKLLAIFGLCLTLFSNDSCNQTTEQEDQQDDFTPSLYNACEIEFTTLAPDIWLYDEIKNQRTGMYLPESPMRLVFVKKYIMDQLDNPEIFYLFQTEISSYGSYFPDPDVQRYQLYNCEGSAISEFTLEQNLLESHPSYMDVMNQNSGELIWDR